MKKIFFILSVILSLSKGFAQNVGIGTTTPAFKLDVKSGSINTDSLYRINSFPVLSINDNGNFFAGKNAGSDNTGQDNTGTGNLSLYSNTSGATNTAVGSLALYSNTIGYNNTGIGYMSLNSSTTGYNNAAFGWLSLVKNIYGFDNTAIGTTALHNNTTGSYNACIGGGALYNNTTGSFNTAVGYAAGLATSDLNYVTSIGYNSKADCSNCLALGGTGTARTSVGINNTTPLTDLHIIQQSDAGGDKLRGIRLQRSVNTNHWRTLIDPSNNYVFEYNDVLYSYIDPVGGAFINPSDARLKKDIIPLDNVLDKVMELTPKKFHYKINKNADPLLWGFIAQDVQKIFPEFINEKDDGYLGIAYSNFNIVAIKAIQEQQQEIEELKNHDEKLKNQIEVQQKQIDKMEKQIELLLK